MLSILLKRNILIQKVHLPIHSHPCVSVFTKFLEKTQILALSIFYKGCHDLNPAPVFPSQNLVNNLLNGLRANFNTAFRAVGLAHPGEKDPHVVVYFRNGAHG